MSFCRWQKRGNAIAQFNLGVMYDGGKWRGEGLRGGCALVSQSG